MAYVIAEPCISTCDTACVRVCPCNCIHGPVTPEELETLNAEDRKRRVERIQMFIDPDPCIDCDACAAACPVSAVFPESELPEKWKHYAQLNADFFKSR